MNCLSVFDNFVKLALKGLIIRSDDPHEYFPFGSEKNLFESVNIRLPGEPKNWFKEKKNFTKRYLAMVLHQDYITYTTVISSRIL